MSNFLPKKYELPEEPGKYVKFDEGANTFRVLSSAIVGWEWWKDDKEGNRIVSRVKTEDEIPTDISREGRDRPKHFWAFVVYNYDIKQIQIMQLTQKTIMRAIQALIDDEGWGDPKDYDVVITKSKKGQRDMDVEYSVMPRPKKEMDKGVVQFYKDLNIRLEVLYDGGDPFATDAEKLADEVDKAS